MNEKLSDIGEREILNRLKIYMDVGQIDNDTAIIKSYGKELILNKDILVENVHFNHKISSPEDIGWKAITVNLSDLACSGVNEIIGVTVGLVLPPNTNWQWVNRVYQGMEKALKKYGGKIIGGDCSKGKEKVISITALGTTSQLNLHRSNAKPGDHLVTSGPHGLSRLGLALLESDPLTNSYTLSTKLKSKAIQAHKRPTPPLIALKELLYCKPETLPWRAAGTDSSDGLLEAIASICCSSKCSAELEPNKLPKDPEWPAGNHWEDWCLMGGEDFELVVSIPEKWAEAWKRRCPSIRTIGKITSGEPKVIWRGGQEIKLSCPEFKHF